MKEFTKNLSNQLSAKKIVTSIILLIVWLIICFLIHPSSIFEQILYYTVLYILALWMLTIYKRHKAVRFILKILWLPGIFLIAFYPFLLAILSVILSFGIVYLITVLIFEVLPVDLFNYNFTKPLVIYLEITISSLVVAYFYDKVVGIWDYIFITRDEHKQLSYKIMNQSRAKFSLYFLYFIALLVLNVSRLNNHPVIDYTIEKAILESFGTFLAFERIISNWKMFEEEKSLQ